MKKFLFKHQNKILALSIVFFVCALFIHFFINGAIVKAVGSSGGTLITAISQPPTCPIGIIAPCSCGTYVTTIQPSGGMDSLFCFLWENVPKTGVPINPSSPGTKLLGLWIAAFPVAISTNWGTSFK